MAEEKTNKSWPITEVGSWHTLINGPGEFIEVGKREGQANMVVFRDSTWLACWANIARLGSLRSQRPLEPGIQMLKYRRKQRSRQ